MVDTFGREDVLVNNVNLKGLFFMSHGRWWLDSPLRNYGSAGRSIIQDSAQATGGRVLP